MTSEINFLSAREVMEKQVEAYNARDIEKFIECFSDDVEFIDLPENIMRLKGLNILREVFSELFASSPDLQLKIKVRIECGNFITDHEVIHGAKKYPNGLEVISLNEIQLGKIKRIWFAGRIIH